MGHKKIIISFLAEETNETTWQVFPLVSLRCMVFDVNDSSIFYIR